MKNLTPFFLLCIGLHVAGADELSGPGRRTLVSESWGTIYCQEGLKVTSDAMGIRHRIESPKGPIALARSGQGWLLQSPNQNLVLRNEQNHLDGKQRLFVQFNATRYAFERKGNDYVWNFPGKRVFFTLREGEVRAALGNEGSFTMHKKPGGIAYDIESESGQSSVLVGRRKFKGPEKKFIYTVVKQSGEDLKSHPYLVRGVLFDNGPVGVFIRMPRNPVLEALDWGQVQAITSSIPYPETRDASAEATPSKPRDPLQAVEAKRDEDPLGMKRKPFEKDRSMFDLPQPGEENSGQWSQPPK